MYFYFPKQLPKAPEITKKPAEEKIVKPEETPPLPEESSPQVYLSSNELRQGDTLLVKIMSEKTVNKVSGEFASVKINFFKSVNSENWFGILGIDARKKPGNYDLVINLSDNSQFKKKLNIIERKFPVTELLVTKELEEKGYTPSKIVENITQKENLLLEEVLSIYTPKPYFDRAFINPLPQIEVVGAFGNIRKSGEIGIQHLGVDLEAATGTPVFAINDGIVRFSQELTTYGKTLIIDHGLGIFSLYLHLDKFRVSNTQPVKRGEIIALSGNTGYSISPHLHFSVRVNGASVDPLRFIEITEKELK